MPYYMVSALKKPMHAWTINTDFEGEEWSLTLLMRDGKNLVPGTKYKFPHLAAVAVADFKTGVELWDRLAVSNPAFVAQWNDSGLHDIKKWSREETPRRGDQAPPKTAT